CRVRCSGWWRRFGRISRTVRLSEANGSNEVQEVLVLCMKRLLQGALMFLVGCAAGSDGNSSNGVGGAGGGPAADATGSGGDTGSSVTGFTTSSGAGAGGSAAASVIYAHTNTTLFQVDPISLQASEIGEFDCISDGTETSMTDLAVNSAGELWG